MSQLQDRVAIITGGSRGIGRAVALELARRGAKIVVNYFSNQAEADGVVQAIVDLGSEAVAVQADVSQEADVERLIKGATDAFGRVDILVNNAGTTRDNLIMRMKAEEFDFVLQNNLRSAWLCSKAVVRPMMKNRYGRIINISSISGAIGQAGQTNYSASKAGMIGLTKSLAREIASREITVNAVAPGFILTDLTKDLPEDLKNQLNQFIPLGRWGEVQDVANAVAFLASAEAGYITGHVLNVDGGMGM